MHTKQGYKRFSNCIGLIAQEVREIIPEAIETTDRDDYPYLNNDPSIWTMLNAIKEQQKQIERLEIQNRKLINRI